MDLGHLRYMADQIAKNFVAIGHDRAVAATADHIVKFWDPRMKAAILADDSAALSPVARAAIDLLARGSELPPQTKAPVSGGSDAG